MAGGPGERNAVAVGAVNVVTGNNSSALGASDDIGTGLGFNGYGNNVQVVGSNNTVASTANSTGSSVFGVGNTVNATNAIAIGNGITNTGASSVAIGMGSGASAANSVALGASSVADVANSDFGRLGRQRTQDRQRRQRHDRRRQHRCHNRRSVDDRQPARCSIVRRRRNS